MGRLEQPIIARLQVRAGRKRRLLRRGEEEREEGEKEREDDSLAVRIRLLPDRGSAGSRDVERSGSRYAMEGCIKRGDLEFPPS